MTEKPRKKVAIEGKTYRKLEKGAKNKNMTVEQYTDFLFKDFPDWLGALACGEVVEHGN